MRRLLAIGVAGAFLAASTQAKTVDLHKSDAVARPGPSVLTVRLGANIYRVVVGEPTSAEDGGLTVTQRDAKARQHVVFHRESWLLDRVIADHGVVVLVTKSGGSEAWAIRNAFTYDPYRLYRLIHGRAVYSLTLSRLYSKAHYCAWQGPRYDEHYAAVGPQTGKSACRVMNQAQFSAYEAAHREMFAR